MQDGFSPGVFLISVAGVVGTLTVATLLGRLSVCVLPGRLKSVARFYVAPAFGLALLTVVASVVGRILPFDDSLVVIGIVSSMLLWSLLQERDLRQAFQHTLLVSVVGLVCGASMLVPLFLYGAIDTHNDTFTYLSHGGWLQNHAFGDTIAPQDVRPLNSQIYLYQVHGLRMGGSFLLALIQSLMNVNWTYDVYPSVVISALTVCCLAMGLPLACSLRRLRRGIRVLFLALPAFSFGGLVFGMNAGFLPQTLGLALGAAFLFVLGPMLRWIVTAKTTLSVLFVTAIPTVILFTGATFAYSELTPFLFVSVIVTGIVLSWRHSAWRNMLYFAAVTVVLTSLLLNTELLRAYSALQTQSGAVVGSPVDWSLAGFLGHALGLHDGVGGPFQWSASWNPSLILFAIGTSLVVFTTVLVLHQTRFIWRNTLNGTLMPTIVLLLLLLIGFGYFRYLIPSPFQAGVGQSWSQFKLSEWAHPFASVLVLQAVLMLRVYWARAFSWILLALFSVGIISASYVAIVRVNSFMNYYAGVYDLGRFFVEFRKTVMLTCPRESSIYLNLDRHYLKFRQMASVYLYDRDVRGDWRDDVYISYYLPKKRLAEMVPDEGSCIVEPRGGSHRMLGEGVKIGSFVVGSSQDRTRIRIRSVDGAHEREADADGWWYWVERKITFKMHRPIISNDAWRSRIRFEYSTRGNQQLTVQVSSSNGEKRVFSLQSDGESQYAFDKVVDIPPSEFAVLSIESDGTPTPLGNTDQRLASWIIYNVNITSELDGS